MLTRNRSNSKKSKAQAMYVNANLLRPALVIICLIAFAAGIAALPYSASGAGSPQNKSKNNRKKKSDNAPSTQDVKPGVSESEEGEEYDADLPEQARGKIDKGAYLRAREDHINLLRGLSYDTPNGRVNAIQEMEAQEQEANTNAPAINNITWTSIGPAPIPNGQTSPISAVSGRTTAIAVDPTDPNIAYVGTAQGGVYRTVDGGTTWTAIFDSAQSLAIGAIAVAPSDRTIVYVGTGEPNLSADSFFGVGLYRINNANTTADLTGPINPPVTTGIAGTTAFTGRAVCRIVVHPTDPATIFVGTASGTSSNPSGGSFGTVPPLALRGLYRSTNATAALASIAFTKLTVTTAGSVAPDTSGNRNVMDIVLEPGNSNNLVCTVLGTNAANDGGVYRTTNALAATPTFTRTLTLGDAAGGSSAGRAELAINNVASVVTVFVASGESSGAATCGTGGTLRKSTDGGATWSAPIAAGNGFCAGQCFYNIALAVDPNNANNVLLGGNVPGSCSKLISRSINGGTTFTNVSSGVHADNHVAVFAPSNTAIAYMGTDGGIYKSTNGGANWSNLNNAGFNATQFQGLATHPSDRELMIGGTQDNGTEKRLTDGTWTNARGGDGGYALIDQNAIDTTNVTMYHTFFNQTNAQITWERSTNAGTSWTSFNCPSNGITCSDAVLFYAPMALGPGTPLNTLYFGTDRLYRSTTGVLMTLASQAPIVAGQVLTTIGISPQNDNVRIVGLRNGQVFATTTGSLTLTDVTNASFPANKVVGRVAIDPNSPGAGPFRAYVTFGGYDIPAGQHIWKTTNLAGGAATWVASGSGLPDVPVNCLVVDRANSNRVYVGTDIGVYRSLDAGLSWIPFSNGLPRVAVFDIAFQEQGGTNPNRILRIATHGRGIWEISVPSGPTIAKITDAAATAFDDGRVLLEWRTSNEMDNLGFNVYREVDGVRTRITSQVIAGSALLAGPETSLLTGHSYRWADSLVAAGREPRYWIEDIDLRGKSVWTGPIEIKMARGKKSSSERNAALLSSLGLHSAQITGGVGSTAAAEAVPPAKITLAAMQIQSSIASQPAVKLSVNREGWYRVSQSELVRAGLDAKADPRNLQLYVDGQQVAIAVTGEQDGKFDPSDAMEFYGIAIDAASTGNRVYWLVAGSGPGQRIKSQPSRSAFGGAGSFAYTVERKDRTIYFSSLTNGDVENFFGPVIARDPVDQTLTLQHLAQSSPAGATLDIALQGVTLVPHQVKVLLNDVEAGTINFANQARGTAKFPVSQSRLKEGENVVRFVTQGGERDVTLLDSIRITYQHSFTADSNVLRLTAKGSQQISVDGFTASSIRVIDVTDPNAPQEVTGTIKPTGKSNYSVSVTVPGSGDRKLLAFGDATAGTPVMVAANIPSNLRQPGAGADLIIITRRDFFAALEPLVALRRGQGLSVMVVDAEDIFDEFSYGQKLPQAVKDFILYARNNWNKPPRFALLFGDASFDPKNYLGFGDNDSVPTKLIDTQYMETASDDWFADSNADAIPEIAIGRLPARTAAEASRMVAKLTGYRAAEMDNAVLLVSDSDEGYKFSLANKELHALIPADVKVQEINRNLLDSAMAKSQLIEAINAGQRFVNYTGHGNTDQWRANIFTATDARALTNGQRLPLFLSMTCLNGYFQDASADSLSESLLKAERGGAIAVWASSGMTEPVGQTMMNQQLFRTIFGPNLGGNQLTTLGEVTIRAKHAVSNADVRRTWILFGDPSMKLK